MRASRHTRAQHVLAEHARGDMSLSAALAASTKLPMTLHDPRGLRALSVSVINAGAGRLGVPVTHHGYHGASAVVLSYFGADRRDVIQLYALALRADEWPTFELRYRIDERWNYVHDLIGIKSRQVLSISNFVASVDTIWGVL